MKTRYTVALSILAGVAVGAAAVQALHAQEEDGLFLGLLQAQAEQGGGTHPFAHFFEHALGSFHVGGHAEHEGGLGLHPVQHGFQARVDGRVGA